MEFIKRHHDMNMGSSSSATSMMMDMASLATSTMMDMASLATSTMMNMATSTMDHSTMDHSSHMSGMSGMSGMSSGNSSSSSGHKMGMHMWLTRDYANYPVLFKELTASNKGQAFGIFVLLFFVAFLTRMLEFVRNYLEEIVWKNNNFLESEQGVVQPVARLAAAPVVPTCCANAREAGNYDDHVKSCCAAKKANENSSDDSIDKTNSPHAEAVSPRGSISLASRIWRDAIRLALCIIPDLFSYSLMLAAMTYTLVYFFPIVIGSGVGRWAAERSMEHYRIKRSPPRDCC